MMTDSIPMKSRSQLRKRILASVGAVVLISLLGSTFSLYRITEVNHSFTAMSRLSMPLERLIVQMQVDGDVLKRELERGLGYVHWKDPRWKPRPIPAWITDVMDREVDKVRELLAETSDHGAEKEWSAWFERLSAGWTNLKTQAEQLYASLEAGNFDQAQKIYPVWFAQLENWKEELDRGVKDAEKMTRDRFSQVQSSVRDLRTGLQIILFVVIFLSLFLIWLGERALRPLADLTKMAREITQRGLQKGDKTRFPEISLSRDDEVGQLAQEFRRMATVLLEREKSVESHKHRLETQNLLLREMSELNKNILDSIESALLVVDSQSRITQCNPVALKWFGWSEHEVKGQFILCLKGLQTILGQAWPEHSRKVLEGGTWVRLDPQVLEGKTFGSTLMPLRREDGSTAGLILVVEDLTEQLGLQKRLRLAENLAAVGRMSAQVAHEVRNPLHSIGLETEMAIEACTPQSPPSLKQSLQSIQASVERLERITDNYLKLSKLSAGEKRLFRVDAVLEEVLAIYAPACESQGVKIDWTREQGADFLVMGDAQLFEQALGNLFRNALQALDSSTSVQGAAKITWKLGNTESGRIWITIEDNGPGLAQSIQDQLFSPFVTTKAQGTGLGLSFVKQVVEELGGEIRHCESNLSECGTRFEILIPQAMRMSESDSTSPQKEHTL